MNINEPTRGKALALPFTKATNPTHPSHTHAHSSTIRLRLRFSHRIPDDIRNHFIAMCGEYVGTILFLYFALSGCQVANTIHSSAGLSVEETGANPQQLQYIALSFGFSLAVNVWVFFRISGGLFNPAVTVGMCLIGALPWVRGILLFFVQILGGITASALVSCMFPGPLAAQTSLGGGTSVVQGLFIEMILTAQLIFTIFMLAVEKHKGTFIAPIGIGLALFIAELTGVYFTGGSLNPARSFGPSVVNHSFHSYDWIYWVGPILGAVVAAGFYKFIKMLNYETANPDQDAHESHVVRQRSGEHSPLGEKRSVDYPLRNGTAHTTAYASRVNGTSTSATNGAGTYHPNLDARRPSKARMDSAVVETNDEAFHGLESVMNADEIVRGSPRDGRTVSGIV